MYVPEEKEFITNYIRELSASQLTLEHIQYVPVTFSGPKPHFKGTRDFPRVQSQWLALLAASCDKRLRFTFAVLHFVWQSPISPFPLPDQHW